MTEPRLPDPGMAAVLAPKWRTTLARLREEREGAGPKVLLLLVVVDKGVRLASF